MAIRVLSLLLVFVTSGCVSTKIVALPDAQISKLNGKTITYVSREKPAFSAMTAGKASAAGLFGAIGGAVAGGAMVSAGNKIVQENSIADPAEHMAQTVINELAAAHALAFKENGKTLAKTADPNELIKLYAGTDLLLDVQTASWGFGYFPTNWTHYHVIYGVRLRLLSSPDGKVLAEGTCVRGPEKTVDGAPTYDELLANGAARLKTEINSAAESCITELKSKVLKL